MNTDELKRACEMAGLIYDSIEGNYNWGYDGSGQEGWSLDEDNPALPAYVAELLTAKVLATDKAWAYSLFRDDGYGATCWTSEWSRKGRKVQCVECLFIVSDNIDASRSGSIDLPDGVTVIWCRGEDDDDPFCGKAEVEIRAAMAVLSQEAA